MDNCVVNDVIIKIRKELERQVILEYGEDALLEDGKYFTKNEVLNIINEVLKK